MTRSRTRSSVTFLPNRRWLVVFGVLSILLSLLMPLVAVQGAATAAAAATAQDESSKCDPGFVLSEDGSTCVPDPNLPPPLECQPGTIPNEAGTECVPDPNLPPPLECQAGMILNAAGSECVPDPNVSRAQGDPVYVLVRKYVCPSGTDWYQATPEQFSECSPNVNQVTFVVTAPDGLDWVRPIPGGSQWGPWAAGDVRIVEEVPTGYGTPIVFCGAAPTGEIPELTLLGATNQVDWSLTGGQTLTCDYYNIPLDIQDGVWVEIFKYNCPPGSEPSREDPTTFDYQQCQDLRPVAGVTFELLDEAGLPIASKETGAEGTSDYGKATFSNLAPGTYGVSEVIPEGYKYAVTLCWDYGEDDRSEFLGAVWLEGNGTISASVEAGHRLLCNVYNIPDDGSDGTPVAGTNSLQFYKYRCPPDLPRDADQDYYEQNCQPQYGVTFNLQHPGGSSGRETDGGGDAAWSGLPIGDWTATETLPSGYGDPLVWCQWVAWPTDAGLNDAWTRYDAPGGIHHDSFGYEGMVRECHWYNFPIEGEGGDGPEGAYDMVFGKFVCSPGAPTDQDKAYYEQQCQPAEGWAFSIFGLGGEHEITTDASGFASLTGVPATRNFGALEHLREGYGPPRTWCRVAEWADGAEPGPWEERQDNSLEAPLLPSPQSGEPGAAEQGQGIGRVAVPAGTTRFECHWYNFPLDGPEAETETDYNYVDFFKYMCPAAAPEGAGKPWHDQNCQPAAGWELTVQWDGGGSTEVTDASGHAGWSGLPTGTWTGAETLPPGFDPPTVWCRYTEWQSDSLHEAGWIPFEVSGAEISGNFEFEGIRIECRWYNYPTDEPVEDTGTGDNSVDFSKYLCPPDVPRDAEEGYYNQNCQPLEGVTFELQYAGGGSSQTTDASGYAGWSGLPIGDWTATETLPEGYDDPLVWCRWVEWPSEAGLNNDWSRFDAPGGAYGDSFGYEGMRRECRWYNFGDDTYNWVDFVKYVCTYDVPRDADKAYYEQYCRLAQGWEFKLEWTTGQSTQATDAAGYAGWPGLPVGDWTATETLQAGYGDPIVWCRWREWPQEAGLTDDWSRFDAPGGAYGDTFDYEVMRRECHWYNFEPPLEKGRITIYKYQCAPGAASTDLEALREECATPFDGVPFRLEYGGMTLFAATSGGVVDWRDLDAGSYRISERLLPGYEQPRAWCGYVLHDGDVIDPASRVFDPYPVTGGVIEVELTNVPAHLVCYWYNFPTDPGEITISKWLCPPGYDVDAWGADPKADCTTAQDGITFTLARPAGEDLVSSTGEAIPGAVSFGGLSPGPYTITESPPPDTAYAFVLDCTGAKIAKVHPAPLSWGTVLDVNVASGDTITCNWYNVPDPDNGWVTVHKYACWTTDFTSAVDCETWEHGASFELFGYPSETSYGAGDTNAGGQYTWHDLPAGAYTIDEIGQTACKITSTKVDGEGRAWVDAGAGTLIKVYNCATSESPGKAPGKYPNTGAGPSGEVPLASHQDTPAGTPTPAAGADPEAYYEIRCLNDDDLAAAGTPVLAAPVTDATAPPIELEATGTPTVVVITFGEAPSPETAVCERGAIPQRLVIDSAEVDHDVEILEIVDGVMQQPTGPDVVSWFKETGRLGEANNVVIAGHLNWWDRPEGVFYHLQGMEAGDRIEVAGDDGATYVYEVEWVRQESNLAPPAADVIGPTDGPSLTLITCGGEWDASISEYDERTVVRAVQVEVIPAGT